MSQAKVELNCARAQKANEVDVYSASVRVTRVHAPHVGPFSRNARIQTPGHAQGGAPGACTLSVLPIMPALALSAVRLISVPGGPSW